MLPLLPRSIASAVVAITLATLTASQGTVCVSASGEHVAPDTASLDAFGTSLSVSGDWCVVGAPDDDDSGASSGSAHVFEHVGGSWVHRAKLTASDGAAFDRFGSAVAIAHDLVAVGAPGDDNSWSATGSAYVFRRTLGTWVEEDKLIALDSFLDDQLGQSIAVEADTVVVGAPDEFFTAGSADVFRFDGSSWSQEAKLTPTPSIGTARFGTSVSLSSGRAFVGAPAGGAVLDGSAFVFLRTAGVWTQEAELLATGGTLGDAFGTAIDSTQDLALVGAPGRDDAGTDAGAALVFVRSGSSWTEATTLTASNAAPGDAFGQALSASGNVLVVGAPARDGDTGRAYLYMNDGAGWPQRRIFDEPTPTAGHHFGAAVATSRDRIALGAPSPNGNLVSFTISGAWDAYGTGLAGSGGFVPVLDPLASCPSIGDTPSVRVTNGLGGAPGVLLIGKERIEVPLYGGTLLVAPPLFGQVTHTLGGTSGVAGSGMLDFPLMPTTPSLFGRAAHAQAGYFDTGAGGLVALTNGLRLTMP